MKIRRSPYWALAAGALSLCQAGCTREEKAEAKGPTEPAAVVVTVAPLERRQVERTVEVVGSLRGWEQVVVGSKRAGRIQKVFHDVGDRVKADEPLAQIDPVDARMAYDVAESKYLAELVRLGISSEMADSFIQRYGITETLVVGPQTQEIIERIPAVVQVRASVEKVQRNLARQRNLSAKGAGTAQELDDLENDYRAAVASYENAKTTARNVVAMALSNRIARDQAEQTLKDLTIRTPQPQQMIPGHAAGTPAVYAITGRSVSEGQMIREGDEAFNVVIENPLRLRANVPERYSANVRQGQPVRISATAMPGRTFEGKVSRVNPSVDPTSRTIQVEALIPNDEGLLRPGGFAKAVIVTDVSDDAIVAPVESIVQFAGVTKLFVIEDGKARAVDDLTTGVEGQGWVEVRSARLPKSGVVATTAQGLLAEGSKVIIREPEKGENAGRPPAVLEAKPGEAPAAPKPAEPQPARH